MFGNKKGISNIVGAFIGLMVVIIIAVSVVIPVVQNTITSGNFSDPTLNTVLGIIPLLMVVAIVLLVVGLYGGGKK